MTDHNPYSAVDFDTLALECQRMARELLTSARTAEERMLRTERAALLLAAVGQRITPHPANGAKPRFEGSHDPSDFVESHLESYEEQAKQIRYRVLVRATSAVLGPKAQDWIRDSRLGDPRTKTCEIAQDSDEGLRRALVLLAALRR